MRQLIVRVCVFLGWVLVITFVALKTFAQTPVSCEEALATEQRALAIIRSHELDMTKTAAAYSLRFEKAEAKVKELQAQVDSQHE